MVNETSAILDERVSNLVDLLYTSANRLKTVSNVQYTENWSDANASDFYAGCQETNMLLRLVPRIERTLSKNGYDILYQPKPYELKGQNFMQQRTIDTSALIAQGHADGIAKEKIEDFKTGLENIVSLVNGGTEQETEYVNILNNMYSIVRNPANPLGFSKRDFYFEVPVKAIFDYLENKLLPTLKEKVDHGIQPLNPVYTDLNSGLNELQDIRKKFGRFNPTYKGLITPVSAAKVYAFEAGTNRQPAVAEAPETLEPRE